MLMLEHLDHLAETAAKAISNIKFDKIVVWDAGRGDGSGAGGFLSSLAGAVPPLMHVMKRIGGVEMPEYFGKMATPDSAASTAERADAAAAAPTKAPAPGSRPASGKSPGGNGGATKE